METTMTKKIWTALGVGALLVALPLVAIAQEGGDSEPVALELVSLTLAKGIEEGQPVDPGDSFARSDGRIFAIVRLTNPSRTETHVRVAWENAEGPERQGMRLQIPAQARYRTVARTGTGRPAGRYRCVVRDASGNVLGQQEFSVTE